MLKLQLSLLSAALVVATLFSSVDAAPIPATHTPFFAKRADSTLVEPRAPLSTVLGDYSPPDRNLRQPGPEQRPRPPRFRIGTYMPNRPIADLTQAKRSDDAALLQERAPIGAFSLDHPVENEGLRRYGSLQTNKLLLPTRAVEEVPAERRIVLTKEMQDELHKQGRTSLRPDNVPAALKNIRWRRELDERKLKAGSKPLTDAELIQRFGATAVRVRDEGSQQDTPSHGSNSGGAKMTLFRPTVVGGLPPPPKYQLGTTHKPKDRRDEENQPLPAGGIHPLS